MYLCIKKVILWMVGKNGRYLHLPLPLQLQLQVQREANEPANNAESQRNIARLVIVVKLY
uniref:Uncharacterized protein n=1 Tax=viral metagenome TaxID=1070528 RepID=A0A6C0JZF0_9ZZZZ